MGIEPGTLVAKRYRVQRQLGKGGMGEVFAAENVRTGRAVALKVLRAEAKAKATAIERFRREARAAGSIHSDHVTQVLDVEDDPEHGIVLVFELLEGESLVDRLKRTGPIDFEELWGIVEAVWIGLADAHAAGVVHRDLKPSNVFLQRTQGGKQGRTKILDFGISKLPKKITTQSLTQVGQSLGTFSFMPPEQIGKAKMVDHRADIYACTTLIYQGLSGQLPYQAKNVVAMMELKSRTEPRTLGEAMGRPVIQQLEDFISRGLARDPNERFQSATEALGAWRKLRPPGAVSSQDVDLTDEIEDEASRARTQVRAVSPVYHAHPSTSTDSLSTDRYVPADRIKTIPQEARQEVPAATGANQAASGSSLVIQPTADDDGQPPEAMAQPMAYPAAAAAQQAPPAHGTVGDSSSYVSASTSGMSLPVASAAQPPAGLPPSATGYTEGQAFDGAASDMHLPAVPAPQSPQESGYEDSPSKLRVAVGLILGAVGLMLLGFGIVALAIRLLK